MGRSAVALYKSIFPAGDFCFCKDSKEYHRVIKKEINSKKKSVFPNLGISLLWCTPVTAYVTSAPHCITLWGLGLWELMQDTALDVHFLMFFLINKEFCLCPKGVCSSIYVYKTVHSSLTAAAAVMSDSVRPHRWQPTRLPRPWDSPGKNTGVGCHFLLQCMKVKVKVKSLSHVRLLVTPRTAAYQAPPSTGYSRQEYWSGVPLPSLSSLTSKLANMVKSLTLQFLTE